MLKLIVFDCDGVMFDSKKANCMYYNQLLTQFNLPSMNEEEQDYVHMSSVTDSVRHIFRHYSDPDLEQVHAYRQQCGYAPFLKYMEMEPDLVDFLEITSKKYNLAISTNRTDTMIPLLKSYQLENFFSKVMTASNAKRPKPAPDGLLEILSHFDYKAEQAIFIGDSVIDQQHAAACNVALIGFKNRKLQAAFHVDSFMEILELPPFQSEENKPEFLTTNKS